MSLYSDIIWNATYAEDDFFVWRLQIYKKVKKDILVSKALQQAVS